MPHIFSFRVGRLGKRQPPEDGCTAEKCGGRHKGSPGSQESGLPPVRVQRFPGRVRYPQRRHEGGYGMPPCVGVREGQGGIRPPGKEPVRHVEAAGRVGDGICPCPYLQRLRAGRPSLVSGEFMPGHVSVRRGDGAGGLHPAVEFSLYRRPGERAFGLGAVRPSAGGRWDLQSGGGRGQHHGA